MADTQSIDYGSNALLKTTPSEADRLLMTNPAATTPESTITFENLRKALGVDYTSLSEQLVPGEYWLDADGVTKRQVYQRTFVGTTASTAGSYSVLTTGIRAFKIESSNVFGGESSFLPAFVNYSAGNFVRDHLYQLYNSVGEIILAILGDTVKNRPYVITLKYTKA